MSIILATPPWSWTNTLGFSLDFLSKISAAKWWVSPNEIQVFSSCIQIWRCVDCLTFFRKLATGKRALRCGLRLQQEKSKMNKSATSPIASEKADNYNPTTQWPSPKKTTQCNLGQIFLFFNSYSIPKLPGFFRKFSGGGLEFFHPPLHWGSKLGSSTAWGSRVANFTDFDGANCSSPCSTLQGLATRRFGVESPWAPGDSTKWPFLGWVFRVTLWKGVS